MLLSGRGRGQLRRRTTAAKPVGRTRPPVALRAGGQAGSTSTQKQHLRYMSHVNQVRVRTVAGVALRQDTWEAENASTIVTEREGRRQKGTEQLRRKRSGSDRVRAAGFTRADVG